MKDFLRGSVKVVLGAFVLLPSVSLAQAPAGPAGEAAVVAETDKRHWGELEAQLRMAANHPNEMWRLYGAESASKGQWRDAMGHFRRAALYADKYSQHRVSPMYWHGVGVEPDPVQAYIWADLAAERGYPQFLGFREKMWEALDDAAPARVEAEGAAVYERYGDPAGKQRFARALSRASRNVTGSRTGFTADSLELTAPGGDSSMLSGMGAADISNLHRDWRSDPRKYWAVEDAMWTHGSVDVGELENVDTASPAGAP